MLDLVVKFVDATSGGGGEVNPGTGGGAVTSGVQTGDPLMIALLILAALAICGGLFVLYKFKKLTLKSTAIFASVLCVIGAVGIGSTFANADETGKPLVANPAEITATVQDSGIDLSQSTLKNEQEGVVSYVSDVQVTMAEDIDSEAAKQCNIKLEAFGKTIFEGKAGDTSKPTDLTPLAFGDTTPFVMTIDNLSVEDAKLLDNKEVFNISMTVATKEVFHVKYNSGTIPETGVTIQGNLPVDAKDYNEGESATVLPAELTASNGLWKFNGWKIDGDETLYKVGDKFNITQDTTLTAQWEELFTNIFPSLSQAITLYEVSIKKGDNVLYQSDFSQEGKFFSMANKDSYVELSEPISFNDNITIYSRDDSYGEQTITIGPGQGYSYSKITELEEIPISDFHYCFYNPPMY